MTWKQSHARRMLADRMHRQWAHWMRHMLPILKPILKTEADLRDRDYIPLPEYTNAWEALVRWERQMHAGFHELPEAEQQSDYEMADMALDALLTSEDSLRMMLVRGLLHGFYDVVHKSEGVIRLQEIPAVIAQEDARFLEELQKAIDGSLAADYAKGTVEMGGHVTLFLSPEEWLQVAREQLRNGEDLTDTLRRLAGLPTRRPS